MGKRGAKAWVPTEEDIANIRLYAGLGATQANIAALIGKGITTLHANPACQEAFEIGHAQAVMRIAGKLFKRADGGDLTAMIFYLKTQGKWRETLNVEQRSVKFDFPATEDLGEAMRAYEKLINGG
jgi:hypothetical protein